MSRHNYSQYSEKKKANRKVEPNAANKDTVTTISVPAEPLAVKMAVERSETASDSCIHSVESAEPAVLMGPIEVLPATITGTVANCAKLNVRAEPDLMGDIACVLPAASELEIDVTHSDSDWLKVYTATGVEGYCMRKFVDAHL